VNQLILDPKNPLAIARQFRETYYHHPDAPTLIYSGQRFHAWHNPAYAECDDGKLRAEIYRWSETAMRQIQTSDGPKLELFKPSKAIIDNIVDALRAEVFSDAKPVCWLDNDPARPNPCEIIVARNGLLTPADPHRTLIQSPTPLLFTHNALTYDYQRGAIDCPEWLGFLAGLWPEDQLSIETLCEWCGYCLTQRTDLQKALLLIGPPRSGKGTIARILTALIGIANVCGPTLSSLTTNFGLWSWIAKQLAIISDARLSGRNDQSILIERLLAITGEDWLTIDRKNLAPVTLKLTARIMLLTNELPRLADASGALANRFVVIRMTESFLGREDNGLTDRILKELPAILNWAIVGYRRLCERGRFLQPESGAEAVQEMQDLASPVGAFVREWCRIAAGKECPVGDLYMAWQLWSREQGTTHVPDSRVFGRDLRAAFPGLTLYQPRLDDGERIRAYRGVGLTIAAQAAVDSERAKTEGRESETYV